MLPTISSPTFELKLISQDQPVRYRPFTVKEEKLLLVAEEGDDEKEILYAIRQIIQNCCVTPLDVGKLPLFDLQYLFLQIRAKSVSNVSTVKYRDKEDDQIREFEIEFDKIVPTVDPNHKKDVIIDEDFVICFKYPTVEMMSKVENINADDLNASIEMVALCIDKIVQGEEVYMSEDYTLEQLVQFIDDMPAEKFQLVIDQFISSMPKMIYTIEYTNELGHEREIVLEGFRSFFQ